MCLCPAYRHEVGAVPSHFAGAGALTFSEASRLPSLSRSYKGWFETLHVFGEVPAEPTNGLTALLAFFLDLLG